jgi:hypothetical protein
MPVSVGRGMLSATLGLPGDVAGMARGANLGPTPQGQLLGALARHYGEKISDVLPTSDQVSGALPSGPQTSRVFEQFGRLAPLTPGQIIRGAAPIGRGALQALDQMMLEGHPLVAGASPLNVIKPKGGNWLTGDVDTALSRLQKETATEAQLADLGTRQPPDIVERMRMLQAPDIALNKWVQGPLAKYIKRDMGTEGDPIRALAEQGILHVDPEQLNYAPEMWGRDNWQGERQQWLAKSPTAKVWEGLADNSISSLPQSYATGATLEKYPWITKLDPSEELYGLHEPRNLANDAGFDHLRDELRNALNPASGLPRNLQLNPADMQQMGIDRAVRHVANINKWRADQQVAANAAKANNAATQVVKEYPENNPLGLRWVELKAPEFKPPEGYEYDRATGNYVNPWEDVQPISAKGYGEKALQDALKYEGDTMGHCVGGYCEDVASGRSRIYSLRDAKGQPHVTIETRPHTEGMSNLLNDETANKYGYKQTANIVQIKGKQNRAPNPEYLPFVQDFVKNQGPWSSVGDIHNTGLRPTKDVFNAVERLHLQNKGIQLPAYLTPDEIDALQTNFSSASSGTQLPGIGVP